MYLVVVVIATRASVPRASTAAGGSMHLAEATLWLEAPPAAKPPAYEASSCAGLRAHRATLEACRELLGDAAEIGETEQVTRAR